MHTEVHESRRMKTCCIQSFVKPCSETAPQRPTRPAAVVQSAPGRGKLGASHCLLRWPKRIGSLRDRSVPIRSILQPFTADVPCGDRNATLATARVRQARSLQADCRRAWLPAVCCYSSLLPQSWAAARRADEAPTWPCTTSAAPPSSRSPDPTPDAAPRPDRPRRSSSPSTAGMMSLEKHAAWQLLHGVLAFGPKFEILAGDKKVVALDWVFDGKPMRGWTLTATQAGRARRDRARQARPGTRRPVAGDHLAVATCPSTRPIIVGGQAVHAARHGQAHDVRLLRRQGKQLDDHRPVDASRPHRPDVDRPRRRGVDGRTARVAWKPGPIYDEEVRPGPDHHRRLRRHAPADRPVDRAEQLPPATSRRRTHRRLARGAERASTGPIDQAKRNQLPSGAFSIAFFQRPANSANLDEHLAATGHILEFLSFALPKEQLENPWVRRAVAYLCRLLERTKHLDLECGAPLPRRPRAGAVPHEGLRPARSRHRRRPRTVARARPE